MVRLTAAEQAAQDAELERRAAVERTATPTKGAPANRAERRARAQAIARATRRRGDRLAIDPTPAQRPSSRLHGRCRHDQDRRAFDARARTRRTAIAFRGMGKAMGVFADGLGSVTRVLASGEERLVEAGLVVEGGRR